MNQYGQAIEDIVNASYDHPTAEQIFMRLRDSYPHVVRATVYNNLNRLCDEGKIIRLSPDGRTDRYDRTARHDHLICTKCGRIDDLHFMDLTDQLRLHLNSEVHAYDLRVSWTCPDCRDEQENTIKQ